MGGEAIGLTTNLTGDVQSVSADALIDETTKEPYYLAQVVIDRSSLRPELLQRLVPGMPADVLTKLNGLINVALADPGLRDKAMKLGMDARGSTPGEMRARMVADIDKWAAVIDKAGIEKQ